MNGVVFQTSTSTTPIIAVLELARIDFGPIFVATSRNGLKATGERLSDKHVARLIKSCAREAGLRPDLPEAERVRLFELGRVFRKDAAVKDSDTSVADFDQPMRVAGLAFGTDILFSERIARRQGGALCRYKGGGRRSSSCSRRRFTPRAKKPIGAIASARTSATKRSRNDA